MTILQKAWLTSTLDCERSSEQISEWTSELYVCVIFANRLQQHDLHWYENIFLYSPNEREREKRKILYSNFTFHSRLNRFTATYFPLTFSALVPLLLFSFLFYPSLNLLSSHHAPVIENNIECACSSSSCRYFNFFFMFTLNFRIKCHECIHKLFRLLFRNKNEF